MKGWRKPGITLSRSAQHCTSSGPPDPRGTREEPFGLLFYSVLSVHLVGLFVVLREVVRPVQDVEHPERARKQDPENETERRHNC